MSIQLLQKGGHNLHYLDSEDSWQKPVITEYQIFRLFYHSETIPANYFAFPWAQMIDDFRHRNNRVLLDTLYKYKHTDTNCFTIFQHVNFRKFLYLCKNLKISHVFTPHKLDSDVTLEEQYNIKIVPISLYPIYDNLSFPIISDSIERIYVASFIGFYNPKEYMSNIREKIWGEFANREDCYIKMTREWHFQSMVFVNKNITDHDTNEKHYRQLLSESVFSLCPSGSGPNSIRIWESLSYGCIPVILSDGYVLPEIDADWTECVVIWKESEIDLLYEYLICLDEIRITKMRHKCIVIYQKYFSKTCMHIYINEYLSNSNILY